MNSKTPNSTAILFGFSFLTGASYVLTSALGISLFLARMGTAGLPLAFAASAMAVIIISMTTRMVIRFVPTRFCVSFTWAGLAAMSLFLASELVVLHHSLVIVGLLYVLAEVRGCLNTVYVTTLANDAFADSPSKRPYVLVAAGAPVAGIIAGLVLSYEVSVHDVTVISETVWLKIIAGLDVLTLLIVNLASRSRSGSQSNETAIVAPAKIDQGEAIVIEGGVKSYRVGLAMLVAVKVAVITLVGYQWKVVAADYFHQESQLIVYFAIFYAVSDVLIVSLQLLASGSLLDRYGIGIPLRLYPVLIALTGIVAVCSDTLTTLIVVFTIGRGLDVMRRSLHDPGLTAAYAILDPGIRRKTIVWVTGIIKPFSEAVIAIALLFIADDMTAVQLTWVWILLTIPWLMFAIRVASKYERATKDRSDELIVTPLDTFSAD